MAKSKPQPQVIEIVEVGGVSYTLNFYPGPRWYGWVGSDGTCKSGIKDKGAAYDSMMEEADWRAENPLS